MPAPPAHSGRPRLAIIGFGFSGLCLGIRLVQEGFTDFVILEKAGQLGGTWRENTYPGAACDVMSFQYCFSFEQKTDWSRKWSGQEEILAYMDECAAKHGIGAHVRFGTEVTSARFDEQAGVWHVQTRVDGREGPEIEAEVLVSGVGQLHKPALPTIPGRESFAGASFHSAQWNHAVDLAGKRVAVVGNGASAIQFVPEIAKEVDHLTVFQRTPNWVIARGDAPYSETQKRLFGLIRPWAKIYRWACYWRQEMLFKVMVGSPKAARTVTDAAIENMNAWIEDPELREKLTPDYPIGAKRILIHDDWFPALARENVDVETSPIARIDATGLTTADGRHLEVDAIIYSTGFETNSFLSPISIEGLEGRTLEKEWKNGAEAYLGLSVAGFPNFFMMYGPNTNLGHNSIIFMIECQANYIIQMVETLERERLRYLDLEPEVMAAFNETLHRELDGTAWARVDHSWYKTASGKITNNWSGTTFRYWRETRRPDLDAYRKV